MTLKMTCISYSFIILPWCSRTN